MARLIDDLLRYGFENPRTSDHPLYEYYRERTGVPFLPWTMLDHKKFLGGTVVIEVDDVARMIPVDTCDSSSLIARRFPCVVPPFDTCFVEFKAKFLPNVYRRAGLLVLRLPTRERAALAIVFLDRYGTLDMCSAGQWEWDDHGVLVPPFYHLAPEEGLMLESHEGDFLNQDFAVMLTAFSLLSCKNVTLRDAHVPIAVDKSHVRRCGRPLIRYKVLDVMPMRKAIAQAGDPSKRETVIKALHICRGHFKDYREHGLFGKTKEVFWWQPHVRGDLASGMIVKDYKIKTDPTPIRVEA